MSDYIYKTLPLNSDRVKELFRLRYQVYVEQWKFESSSDHPDGFERDEYDENSIQIAAIRKEFSDIIGTVRLVQDSEAGFPIEKHMTVEKGPSSEDRPKTIEISRLCVTKEFSRRAEDRAVHDGEYHVSVNDRPVGFDKRDPDNDIVYGLIKALVRESRDKQKTHWYVAMARGLQILLRRRGIIFQNAGPEIDYHGLRRPYFGKIEEVLEKNQELLNIYLGKIE